MLVALTLVRQGVSSINVSGNPKLQVMPLHELAVLSSLTSIDCTDCPRLVSPPPKVAAMGGRHVVSFLHGVASRGVFCCDMPLVVTSPEDPLSPAGGTSLLFAGLTRAKAHDAGRRRLSADSNTRNRRGQKVPTADAGAEEAGEEVEGRVLRAEQWKPEEVKGWDKRLAFTVYDVGDDAGSARPHFYLGRAVYAVCWRVRPGGGAEKEVTDLLDTIQACAPRSSVVMFASDCETVSPEEAEEQIQAVKKAATRRLEGIRGKGEETLRVHDE